MGNSICQTDTVSGNGRWEEENADSDFSVQQEVALDQNAPVILK